MRGFIAVGQVVTDEDMQMYILARFGLEYEALVVSFMQRTDSHSLQEMQLTFQSYELRLAQKIHQFYVTDPSANDAFYGGGRGALDRGSSGIHSCFSKVKYVVCQLCGKLGHVALKCYKRFDVHFTISAPTDSSSPQAFAIDYVSQEGVGDDSTWYMDSSATNHVTNEFGNLTINTDYHGSKSVMVGNGNRLIISSIGSSSIPLSVSDSRPSLLLNNILFIPAIAKNLLSISQFTLDNNVLIEIVVL